MSVGPIADNLFTGVAALTPYYRLWTEKLYENKRLISFLNVVHPHYSAKSEFKERDSEWMTKWRDLATDQTFIRKFTARTA